MSRVGLAFGRQNQDSRILADKPSRPPAAKIFRYLSVIGMVGLSRPRYFIKVPPLSPSYMHVSYPTHAHTRKYPTLSHLPHTSFLFLRPSKPTPPSGAYRMRGIGAGQRIHVFVIPEVAELMARELALASPHLNDGDAADELVTTSKTGSSGATAADADAGAASLSLETPALHRSSSRITALEHAPTSKVHIPSPKPHIHSHTLTFTHIHTRSFTLAHIHSHSHTFIHVHSHSRTFTHIHTHPFFSFFDPRCLRTSQRGS